MASVLRDVELLGADGAPRGLVHADMQPHIERLALTYRGERGLRAFETLDRALGALGHNAGVKIVADWVVLNL
jgi:hypothetical protein